MGQTRLESPQPSPCRTTRPGQGRVGVSNEHWLVGDYSQRRHAGVPLAGPYWCLARALANFPLSWQIRPGDTLSILAMV